MSILQRKQRSLQRPQNRAAGSSLSRTSARQSKVTTHGFYFGAESSGQAAAAAERDLEKIERDLARDRKRREQRLEELERGNAPSSSWNDGSNLNIPAASTSAAAIAGLLAGRQAEQQDNFDDVPNQATAATIGPLASNKKKQSMELRRLLTQRRNLKLLLEDASASPIFKSAPNNFINSLRVNHHYPVHRGTGPICSICGYWGDIRCMRCHERVCGLTCGATHNETRCERPL